MIRLCLILLLCLGFSEVGSPNSLREQNKCEFIIKEEIIIKNIQLDSSDLLFPDTYLQYMTFQEFKDILAYHESRGDYKIINQFGFKGKYQFSNYMIRRFAKVSPEKFLNNPQIQEDAMDDVAMFYIKYLYNCRYTKYINTEIDGVTVTLEGLMLGLHFSPTYLKDWLESNGKINQGDINISIRDYMARFSNKGVVTTKQILVCSN